MRKILSKIREKEIGFCFCGTGRPPHWGGILWGVDPFLTITAYGRQVTIQERGKTTTFEADPLLELRKLLDRYSTEAPHPFPLPRGERVEGEGKSYGAAVGFLGYELWSSLGLGIESQRGPTELPTLFFGFYDKMDHFPFFSPKVRGGGRGSDLESFSNLSRNAYMDRIKKIQIYIAAGDIYQANLTQRFTIPCSASLAQAFLGLCKNHPVPYGAYLRCGDLEILSNSPECFLKYDPQTRVLETWPIKGTRPRGATTVEDARLCEELLTSTKDRAENLMIVDLERNDLSRVCEIGSVQVPKLCEARSYGTVHHLVSQVRGRVREDCDRIDILRACFPGGSVTGAPKLRALQILEELEPSPREVYTGAIGYLGFDGSLHFNVAIRTAWRIGDKLCYAAGGGIVADSDPEKEYEESLLKATILQWILRFPLTLGPLPSGERKKKKGESMSFSSSPLWGED
ncbi:MAG: aminodeoxychorismate synthase component I [Deltaproteobacteria bacterium]|nr:aminodeoxychorismate synthase component I [Deltaproteobacteria bacterium]